ncbi:MAG: hypothetical protein HRT45_15125 [Bdellovibrionales bacterium]|nr:hypothetical protein [Bdellovibrionales bacterium]
MTFRVFGTLSIAERTQIERCKRLLAEGKLKSAKDFCKHGVCPVVLKATEYK